MTLHLRPVPAAPAIVISDPEIWDHYVGNWYRIDGRLVSGFELGHDCPRKHMKVVEQWKPPMTRQQMIDVAVRLYASTCGIAVLKYIAEQVPKEPRPHTLFYYWIKQVRAEFVRIVAGEA